MGSREASRAVIQSVFDDLWNLGSLEVADHLFHPDFRADPGNGSAMTLASLKDTVKTQRERGPRLRYRVENFVIELPWIATRWVGTGIPSDDGEVSRWGMTLWLMKESRIVEAWVLTSGAEAITH